MVYLGYSFRLEKEAKITTISVLLNSLQNWAIPRIMLDKDPWTEVTPKSA